MKVEVKVLEPPFAGWGFLSLGPDLASCDTWIELREETVRRLNALTLEEPCGRAHGAGMVGGTAACGRLET